MSLLVFKLLRSPPAQKNPPSPKIIIEFISFEFSASSILLCNCGWNPGTIEFFDLGLFIEIKNVLLIF